MTSPKLLSDDDREAIREFTSMTQDHPNEMFYALYVGQLLDHIEALSLELARKDNRLRDIKAISASAVAYGPGHARCHPFWVKCVDIGNLAGAALSPTDEPAE